jgi:hypothetical protein
MLSRKMIAVSMVAFLFLATNIGLVSAEEDVLVVPLVEENGISGIPVTIHSGYASIELVKPRGKTLNLPIEKSENPNAPGKVTISIESKSGVEAFTVEIEDWQKSGSVLPLGNGLPSEGEILIQVMDWPDRNELSFKGQQDWPQDEMEGNLR